MDIHDYWIDLEHRETWIKPYNLEVELEDGEPGVEYRMATKVIMNLHALRYAGDDPVFIHMHTNGGFWNEGMAIYDTIKSMPYKVTILSYTHACSMSSIILQAADHRVLMPHSYVMVHHGDWAYEGTFKQAMSNAEFDKKTIKTMIGIYARKSKGAPHFKGIKNIRKYYKDMMNEKEDVFLTPKEAIKWGLADEIFKTWD